MRRIPAADRLSASRNRAPRALRVALPPDCISPRRAVCLFHRLVRFPYIGSSVPKSFPLQRAKAFQWGSSVRRVFVGNSSSKDLVVFDCTIGYGRGRRPRTVVAARGQSGGFGWARFGPDLVTEEMDEWTIVYGSNRLMSIEQIEASVTAFNAPTQPESRKAN